MADCPICCFCRGDSACYQRWTATWTCPSGETPGSWSGPAAAEKQCFGSDSVPSTTWAKITTTDHESCTYEIWVPMGHCCTSDGDCTSQADTTAPDLPADHSDCCEAIPCNDCADTCDFMQVTFSIPYCTDCFTPGGVGTGNDEKWTDTTGFTATICLSRTSSCTWGGNFPATLTGYFSNDGSCTLDGRGPAFTETGFTIELSRGTGSWRLSVSNPDYLLFDGTITVDNCTDTVTINSDPPSANVCPDYPVDHGGTAVLTPCGCTL